jgi:hypothetical protein
MHVERKTKKNFYLLVFIFLLPFMFNIEAPGTYAAGRAGEWMS